MTVRPADRILEIGCGFGVAAALICEQLTNGSYLGIDRSPGSIEAARRRAAPFVAAGTARFLVAAFESFDPGPLRFDLIVAIRVRAFHVDRRRSRSLVRRWLAPGGRLFIEYDPPPRG